MMTWMGLCAERGSKRDRAARLIAQTHQRRSSHNTHSKQADSIRADYDLSVWAAAVGGNVVVGKVVAASS